MARATNTFADLVKLWVERGFRGTPKFTRKRRFDAEFEAYLLAPRRSQLGALVIVTWRGDLWIRFSMPHSFYSADDQRELVSVVRRLLSERLLLVITYRDEAWTGTTLIERGATPRVRRGEVAHVFSWSGRFDERVEAGADKRSNTREKPAATSVRAITATPGRRGLRAGR